MLSVMPTMSLRSCSSQPTSALSWSPQRCSILKTISSRIARAGVVLTALLIYGIIVNPTDGTNGLPCLWKMVFNHECPGCGLSRAGAFLIRGRVSEALSANWLILPTVGLAALHIYSLISKELKIQRSTNH